MKVLSSVLVCLWGVLSLSPEVHAWPNGAPVCTANQAAPEHVGTAGTLADGNLTVSIGGGDPLVEGTPTTLTVGTPVQVTVTGANLWRGILVRIPGATIELPSDGLYQEQSSCPDGTGSITHTSREVKTSVSFTLTMDEPGTDIGMDVNIVQSNPSPSVFFYGQFTVTAEGDGSSTNTEAPTPATTEAPTPATTAPTPAVTTDEDSPSAAALVTKTLVATVGTTAMAMALL